MREIVSEKIRQMGGTILLETEFLESHIGLKDGKTIIDSVSYSQKGEVKSFSPDLVISTAPIKFLLNTMK